MSNQHESMLSLETKTVSCRLLAKLLKQCIHWDSMDNVTIDMSTYLCGNHDGSTLHLPVCTGPKARVGDERLMSGVSRHAFMCSMTVGPVFKRNGTSSSRRPRISFTLVVCRHTTCLQDCMPMHSHAPAGRELFSDDLWLLSFDIHAVYMYI